MEIRDLTAAMHQMVEAKGWYRPDSPRQQTPKNIAASLVIEAAEVLEHFQWREQTQDQEELGAELADVLLYLLQLASVTGIDLEQATLQKIERNYQRRWES
ncbi:MAG: nucleotide pyrophosphohydrolase [Bacillota bacterium]